MRYEQVCVEVLDASRGGPERNELLNCPENRSIGSFAPTTRTSRDGQLGGYWAGLGSGYAGISIFFIGPFCARPDLRRPAHLRCAAWKRVFPLHRDRDPVLDCGPESV